jgi:transposase
MMFAGIDLHRNRSQLVIVDEGGQVKLKRSIRSRPGEFLEVLGGLGDQRLEVAFEATFGWGWLADLFGETGITAHMSHPLATKAITFARVKNDTVDATTLAQLLRTNLLPEAWIAPVAAREARRLIRGRTGLVRLRSRLKCQVHALLTENGVFPEQTDLFGRSGRQVIKSSDLPDISRNRVDSALRLIDYITTEIEGADAEIRRVFTRDPRAKRLLPIPGVGLLTAATIVAEIWDVSRFGSADHLCSWAGLTPTERSSAGHVRRGHVSKQGSRWLRWALVESSIHACRHRDFRDFFERVAARRGRKIARVALARRLLEVCYYALRDDTGSRAFGVAA